MDAELERVYNLLTQAVCAEDVFGELNEGRPLAETLEERFLKLQKVADPEPYNFPDDKELAFDANNALRRFYEEAKRMVAENLYGHRDRLPSRRMLNKPTFQTEKRGYYLGDPIANGTISTVFEGECIQRDDFLAGRVAIKIVDQASDNELIWRERRILQMLHEKNGAQRKHLPVLLDHFKTEDDRIGLVFRCLSQCCDLWTLLECPNYRQGVAV